MIVRSVVRRPFKAYFPRRKTTSSNSISLTKSTTSVIMSKKWKLTSPSMQLSSNSGSTSVINWISIGKKSDWQARNSLLTCKTEGQSRNSTFLLLKLIPFLGGHCHHILKLSWSSIMKWSLRQWELSLQSSMNTRKMVRCQRKIAWISQPNA